MKCSKSCSVPFKLTSAAGHCFSNSGYGFAFFPPRCRTVAVGRSSAFGFKSCPQPLIFFLAPHSSGSIVRRMRYNLLFALTTTALFTVTTSLLAEDVEPGFTPLCDGKTFNGWKSSTDHPDTWKIEDGAFVTRGQTAHLFYVGDLAPFTNFDLKVDVMTDHGANGGIYFHTQYQEKSFPKYGFECQVDNTHSDWKKTGSLYDVVNVAKSPAEDNKWWTQEVIVKGRKVTVKIDGQTLLEYTEPPGAQPGEYTRKLAYGTFALQAHDPKSIVRYKNIRV